MATAAGAMQLCRPVADSTLSQLPQSAPRNSTHRHTSDSLKQCRKADSPCPKAVFEVLHSAQAAQAPRGHDANARTQRLTLLHAVASHHDCAACRQYAGQRCRLTSMVVGEGSRPSMPKKSERAQAACCMGQQQQMQAQLKAARRVLPPSVSQQFLKAEMQLSEHHGLLATQGRRPT